VGRVPPGCQFAPCPTGGGKGCTKELRQCPDGTSVGRMPPSCEFAPCPGSCRCGTPCKTKKNTDGHCQANGQCKKKKKLPMCGPY
jgi:hypothetical protein